MTVGELLSSVPGLRAIGSVDIPSVVAAYALAKAKKKANSELETIEAQRIALCEKHTTRDEAGVAIKDEKNNYVFADPVAFNAEWKQLMAEPVTLSGVRAVTLAELAGAETSPDVLFALGPFVTDPSESG